MDLYKLKRKLLEIGLALSEELGHTTSCVNDALAPRGAHTKASFDQSFSIPTHIYIETRTHTHMQLAVSVHDACVPEEGGHGDSKTRTLLVSKRHRLKRKRPHNLQSPLQSLVVVLVCSFTCYPPVLPVFCHFTVFAHVSQGPFREARQAFQG